MDSGKSEGIYTIDKMKQMATVAQTAEGLEVSGNNFKVNALIGCPDMTLFACERIEALEQELMQIKKVVNEIQGLSGKISCFVENLKSDTVGRISVFKSSLEIGIKISNLDLPEFTDIG